MAFNINRIQDLSRKMLMNYIQTAVLYPIVGSDQIYTIHTIVCPFKSQCFMLELGQSCRFSMFLIIPLHLSVIIAQLGSLCKNRPMFL